MILLEPGQVVFRNVIKAHNAVRQATCFITLASVFNSAADLECEEKACPECFVLFSVLLCLNLLASTHSARCFQVELQLQLVVLSAQRRLVLLEDDQNEAVHYQPAILEE